MTEQTYERLMRFLTRMALRVAGLALAALVVAGWFGLVSYEDAELLFVPVLALLLLGFAGLDR